MTVIVPYPSPADQRDSHIHCSFCKPWRTRTGCWEAVQIYPGLDQRSWQGPGHRLLWSVVLISACVKLKWKTDLKDQLFKSRFLLNVKKKWLTFTCTIYKRKKKKKDILSVLFNRQRITAFGGSPTWDQSDDELHSKPPLHSVCSPWWRRPCCHLSLWQACPDW